MLFFRFAVVLAACCAAARSASALPFSIGHSSRGIVSMPLRAVGFDAKINSTVATANIFSVGYGLQMERVYAASHAAFVIKFHADRDRPNKLLVHGFVGQKRAALEAEPSVSIFRYVSEPDQASRFSYGNGCGYQFFHQRHSLAIVVLSRPTRINSLWHGSNLTPLKGAF